MRYTNSNNRRDHRDAMAAILEVLSIDPGHGGGFDDGIGITHIMFNTGIPWNSLLRFVEMLHSYRMMTSKMERGRKVRARQHHRVFFITPKGLHFLRLYKKLVTFLEKKK